MPSVLTSKKAFVPKKSDEIYNNCCT